ncbi:hypothetical protein CspHIS471_0700510 [Cutaneotrichosporon sp. HIS471]|nr:hypothetical protein CspHIS471_0700510 [Cutaneotrichosporon sp. HIS471]
MITPSEKARSSIDTEAQTDSTSVMQSGKDWTKTAFTPALETSYEVDPFSAQRDLHGDDDYVDFRSMGWIKAFLIATAENIALGLLSFPSIFLRLGVVGGVISTIALGTLAYITAWMMIEFKMNHMGVMHFGDAGGVIFGKWGRRVFGIGMILKSMGLAGSHVLVGQQAITSISSHAICNVWWGVIVTVVSILLAYNREWHKLWWMSFVSVGCILVASMMTIIGTGVQKASQLETAAKGPIAWHAFPLNPTVMDIVGGYTNVLFAYGGNMAVFSFCSEMKNPNDFKKSFALSQIIATVCYCIVGGTVYAFGGQYTTSPALTMTSTPVHITSYSIALVTIMVSGILGANVGAKYLYITWLRDSELLTSKSWRAQLAWMGMVSIIWVVGFLVAELIPFFNQLLTIVSSLFSVWYVCGGGGFLWLYDNSPWFFGRKREKEGEEPVHRSINTTGKKIMCAISILVIFISVVTTPLGLYAAGQGIKDGYSKGKFSRPFAC